MPLPSCDDLDCVRPEPAVTMFRMRDAGGHPHVQALCFDCTIRHMRLALMRSEVLTVATEKLVDLESDVITEVEPE